MNNQLILLQEMMRLKAEAIGKSTILVMTPFMQPGSGNSPFTFFNSANNSFDEISNNEKKEKSMKKTK